MNKCYSSCAEAIADVCDGATIMFGGWNTGDPENLIRELVLKGTKNITAIASDPGSDRNGIVNGLHPLIQEKRVRKFIGSYPSGNQEFMRQYKTGELEFEVCPQGIFVERILQGGNGLFGFYTDVGAETLLAEKKEKRIIDGKICVLETPLKADFAFIKAFIADRWGNLQYRYLAQNFNSVMAAAATVVIAEVENIVGTGSLNPNHIHTPGIYVDRIVKGGYYAQRF